jgi:hypothetical protein
LPRLPAARRASFLVRAQEFLAEQEMEVGLGLPRDLAVELLVEIPELGLLVHRENEPLPGPCSRRAFELGGIEAREHRGKRSLHAGDEALPDASASSRARRRGFAAAT